MNRPCHEGEQGGRKKVGRRQRRQDPPDDGQHLPCHGTARLGQKVARGRRAPFPADIVPPPRGEVQKGVVIFLTRNFARNIIGSLEQG